MTVDHLALGNQRGCLFLGKTISPTPCILAAQSALFIVEASWPPHKTSQKVHTEKGYEVVRGDGEKGKLWEEEGGGYGQSLLCTLNS